MKRRLPILLVIAIACGGGPPDAGDSGIEGVTVSGPQCPVEVVGSPCPDRPISARLVITEHGSTTTVATVRSDADGAFRVVLAPGEYAISSPSPGPPSLAPIDVVVRAHAFTRVNVMFDSGIR